MNNVIIRSPWIVGNLSLRPGNTVQISVVAYEHPLGLPARFCMGLVPAIELSKQLKLNAFKSIIRVMDPTPIANYCNGWQVKKPQFKDIIAEFFKSNGMDFFFDEAEQVCNGALEILEALGAELESSTNKEVTDIVHRIKESGRRHGGELGARNAVLYMAAHPFSWLDMYHPLIWKKSYPSEGFRFVNLMSRPEERFAVIRRFLQKRRPDLCTENNPVDRFMAVCSTPCYIPLAGEPTFADLTKYGYYRCHERYCKIKTKSSNHARAHKDFEALMSFLGLGSG